MAKATLPNIKLFTIDTELRKYFDGGEDEAKVFDFATILRRLTWQNCPK